MATDALSGNFSLADVSGTVTETTLGCLEGCLGGFVAVLPAVTGVEEPDVVAGAGAASVFTDGRTRIVRGGADRLVPASEPTPGVSGLDVVVDGVAERSIAAFEGGSGLEGASAAWEGLFSFCLNFVAARISSFSRGWRLPPWLDACCGARGWSAFATLFVEA